jgi:hypothetical protein
MVTAFQATLFHSLPMHIVICVGAQPKESLHMNQHKQNSEIQATETAEGPAPANEQFVARERT